MVSKNRLEYLINVCACDNENGMKLCQASLNEINSVLKEINEKYNDIFSEPIGHSFIDDKEKMIDFMDMPMHEFLGSYSYLTEKDYEATAEDVMKLTGVHFDSYDEYTIRSSTISVMLADYITLRYKESLKENKGE